MQPITSRLIALLLLLGLLMAPAITLANGDEYAQREEAQAESSNDNANNNGDDDETAVDDEADPEQPEIARVELEPMEATYRARLRRGVSVRGEAVRSLKQRDDGRWDYRFDVDSFIADIRESTILSYEDNRVKPHRYRYSLSGMMIRNRADRLDFEWDKNRIRDREEGEYYDITDYPEIQDQLGAQLQLWVDLKSGKQEMKYIIPDNSGVRDYEFRVIAEEELDTENFGKVKTIKVERVRDADSPRTTHMWFAPDWDYLLVRLEQIHDGGEDFEIYLEKADIGGQRIRP